MAMEVQMIRGTIFLLLILSYAALAASRNNSTGYKGIWCEKHDKFGCDNAMCIDLKYFCDGVNDCGDHSDERTGDSGFQCLAGSGKTCVLPDHMLCDGSFHCGDGSDECSACTAERPSPYFCDGTVDCYGGTDECFCDGGAKVDWIFSDNGCFRCLDRSLTILASEFCDGHIHCRDLSDECLCQYGNSLSICDHINWEHGGKEFSCSVNMSLPFFSMERICDGSVDCPSGIDEQNCTNQEEAIKASQGNTTTSGVSQEYICRKSSTDDQRKKPVKCDHIPDCIEVDDECNDDCPDRPKYCDFVDSTKARKGFFCPEGVKLWGSNVCDGQQQCLGGEDELFCPNSTRFYCQKPTSAVRHVPQSKRCDLRKDCDDSSDELNCAFDCEVCDQRCKFQKHFYCPSADDGEGNKFVDCQKKVCDGSEDCRNGEDECQNCTDGVFSSDDWMISAIPILPFLWIISLIAVVGNAMVIGITCRNMYKGRETLSDLEKGQNYLVLNLALADFCVGLYTLAVSIQNLVLSQDRYCRQDQAWRSSSACAFLGVLLTVGCEASVFILTTITAHRLNSVFRPFVRPPLKRIYLFAAVSWTLALILAIIPLAPTAENYFVESKWFENNEMLSSLKREDLTNYTTKLVAMMNLTDCFVSDNGGIGNWQLMEAIMKNLNPTYVPKRTFGYYSAHGVCAPKFFAIPSKDAAWGYSFFLILINFFVFFFICISYIYIYKRATSSKVHRTSQVEKQIKLQRKLTRMVITDFLCWIPVCIIAFLRVGGVKISEDVYVPVGTIVIPVNSMLNPFLYSEILEWIWTKLLPVRNGASALWASVSPSKEDEQIEMQETGAGSPANTGTVEEALSSQSKTN